jgi:hypothetical protein
MEMKVSSNSGRFFENKAKSMEFYLKKTYINFNVMAIEMKI